MPVCFKIYEVQHLPELFFSILTMIIFQSRGMQSTIYVEMTPGTSHEDLYQHLRQFYEVNDRFCQPLVYLFFVMSSILDFTMLQKEEFVVLLEKNQVPHTRHVRGSNYCLINVFPDRIPGRAIIISVVSSHKNRNKKLCH